MYKLDTPQKDEYEALLALWEASAKATHHFLSDHDISDLKKIIEEKQVFGLVNLTCVRDNNNTILGFIGISGDKIEMLFVDPHHMGQGIGKILLLHAINDARVTKVDVNEQNGAAVRFYEYFGFKIISRSELDGHGNAFPILHMELG